MSHLNENIEIINYSDNHKEYFKSLNLAWIEKFFWVEEFDEMLLSYPEKYILNKGGFIYFAQHKEKIVGTVALIKLDNGDFELSKMAVTEDAQGLGIGKLLIEHCISIAKKEKAQKLILYSNTILDTAIYLYRKYGFSEIKLEDSEYKRSNIKMEKRLSN